MDPIKGPYQFERSSWLVIPKREMVDSVSVNTPHLNKPFEMFENFP